MQMVEVFYCFIEWKSFIEWDLYPVCRDVQDRLSYCPLKLSGKKCDPVALQAEEFEEIFKRHKAVWMGSEVNWGD